MALEARLLAVMMSTHARLEAESGLKVLDDNLVTLDALSPRGFVWPPPSVLRATTFPRLTLSHPGLMSNLPLSKGVGMYLWKEQVSNGALRIPVTFPLLTCNG